MDILPSSEIPTSKSATIPGLFDLLGHSFNLLKQRLWQLILIPVLANILMFTFVLTFGIIFGLSGTLLSNNGHVVITIILAGILIIVAILLMIYIGIWSQAALVHVIVSDEKIGVWEAFKKGSHDVFKLLTIFGYFIAIEFGFTILSFGGLLAMFGLLAKGYTLGGFLAGILSLLGSIAIAYTLTKIRFAMYPMIKEGVSSREAILKSWRVTDGVFWKIFGRLLGLIALLAAIFISVSLITAFLKITILTSILQFALGLVLPPFLIIFSYQIYQNLPNTTPSATTPKPLLAGMIISVLLIVSSVAGGVWVYYNSQQLYPSLQQIFLKNTLPSTNNRSITIDQDKNSSTTEETFVEKPETLKSLLADLPETVPGDTIDEQNNNEGSRRIIETSEGRKQAHDRYLKSLAQNGWTDIKDTPDKYFDFIEAKKDGRLLLIVLAGSDQTTINISVTKENNFDR